MLVFAYCMNLLGLVTAKILNVGLSVQVLVDSFVALCYPNE